MKNEKIKKIKGLLRKEKPLKFKHPKKMFELISEDYYGESSEYAIFWVRDDLEDFWLIEPEWSRKHGFLRLILDSDGDLYEAVPIHRKWALVHNDTFICVEDKIPNEELIEVKK